MYYIVPLLQIHQQNSRILNDYYSLKRLLYVVMNVFSQYFIEHRDSLQQKFFLIIYEIDNITDPVEIQNKIEKISKPVVLPGLKTSITRINNFYKMYSTLIDIFKLYTNITFSWKGETKNI